MLCPRTFCMTERLLGQAAAGLRAVLATLGALIVISRALTAGTAGLRRGANTGKR